MFGRLLKKISDTVKSIFSIFRRKEAKKELCMDISIIAPYVFTDVLLYYASYLNFLTSLSTDPTQPENESWYLPAYWTGTLIMSITLAPALFLAFSDTTGRMFKIPDNEYKKIKASIRKIVGLPGSVVKVISGDISLYKYLLSSNYFSKKSSAGIACATGIIALPALASFLWSDHNKSSASSEQHRISVKHALAYLIVAIYALDVGFVYFDSALKIPKNLGYLDHSLSYENDTEHAAYVLVCIGTFIESIAVFLAFARLNANMFGLIHYKKDPLKKDEEETGCWVELQDSWIKKSIGSFGVLFKVFNTAVVTFHFLKNKVSITNIGFIGWSTMAGLLAQGSLLVADPINNKITAKANKDGDVENEALTLKASHSVQITYGSTGGTYALEKSTTGHSMKKR